MLISNSPSAVSVIRLKSFVSPDNVFFPLLFHLFKFLLGIAGSTEKASTFHISSPSQPLPALHPRHEMAPALNQGPTALLAATPNSPHHPRSHSGPRKLSIRQARDCICSSSSPCAGAILILLPGLSFVPGFLVAFLLEITSALRPSPGNIWRLNI